MPASSLFTKDFLEQLDACLENYSIVDYIMASEKKSFHDAVLRLSEFCELKPEYIVRK